MNEVLHRHPRTELSSTKEWNKVRELQKWLAEERQHAEDVDEMLLVQSRRHRALERRSGIGRFVVKR